VTPHSFPYRTPIKKRAMHRYIEGTQSVLVREVIVVTHVTARESCKNGRHSSGTLPRVGWLTERRSVRLPTAPQIFALAAAYVLTDERLRAATIVGLATGGRTLSSKGHRVTAAISGKLRQLSVATPKPGSRYEGPRELAVSCPSAPANADQLANSRSPADCAPTTADHAGALEPVNVERRSGRTTSTATSARANLGPAKASP
jgi:hypothetical protein